MSKEQVRHAYTDGMEQRLRAAANKELAGPMKAYMRDQFPFLGIRTPERSALIRSYLREQGIPRGEELQQVVRELWALPEREFQYAAMTLLDRRLKEAGPEMLPLYEELILTRSWWDTVDLLASHQVGGVLARHPELRAPSMQRWLDSGQLWLQRTALLFQLGWKERTDTGLLFAAIRYCADDSEFFIRKAIGWALREYSKTDEAAVRQFVAQTPLSPLSVKEALKASERRQARAAAAEGGAEEHP